MVLGEIEKSKFAQVNDKRYYFGNGIVFLPFSHPFLLEIVKFKREREREREKKKNKKLKQFYNKKNKLIPMAKFAIEEKQKNSNL